MKISKKREFAIFDKKIEYTYNDFTEVIIMTDIEIASNAHKKKISEIATKIGIDLEDIILYGNDKAKIKIHKKNVKGKLVLVTAISPTPYGEGKTTVSIGLGDALNRMDKNCIVALREPSMGPVFGMKGGATGGGYSQVVPMEDINLHFTGDFHAITEANNLLCAAIDNHIYWGNELDIQEVVFNRCIDVNDRKLRNSNPQFDITAASEVMAIVCLAKDIEDLKERLGNIVIGYNSKNEFLYAKQLDIEGCLSVILKDALLPNLVQTLEHTPVLIHGGPFANIAHGCSSIRSTQLALSLADYVITEAGFGSDLGAEKFFDIKCRVAQTKPDCIVLVATIKALKYNDPKREENLSRGLSNLEAHINILKKTNSNIVVCLNQYEEDLDEEISIIRDFCKSKKTELAICTSYKEGGKGAIELANKVLHTIEKENKFNYLYDLDLSIKDKINRVCREVYCAKDILYTESVEKKIKQIEKNGIAKLPICVAKTQYSISDDKNKVGYPKENTIHVDDIKLFNGAGFITVYLGNILTMPGLSNNPNYKKINIINNKIKGMT